MERSGEKMDRDDVQRRIQEEEDYIRCPKFANSLSKFVAKNSDGIENKQIAKLLMVSEEEVECLYEDAVTALREEMVE